MNPINLSKTLILQKRVVGIDKVVNKFKDFSRPNIEIKYFSRTLTEFKDFSRQLVKFLTFSRIVRTMIYFTDTIKVT